MPGRLFALLTFDLQKTSVPTMTRRASPRSWTHAAIVAVMAYAFVLQALLLSVGGAFHAAAAAEPQGVICIQDGSSTPGHAPAKAHEDLCCTLSCHGSGAAGPAPFAAVPARVASSSLTDDRPADWPPVRLTSNVLPLGSRAPPRLG
jgi:hypothetical protein